MLLNALFPKIFVGASMAMIVVSSAFSQQKALNVDEWATAAKILDRAGKLIQEKGWQQGAVESTEHNCTATALENAWKESGGSLVDFNYARDALSSVIKLPREPAKLAHDPLAVPYWGRHFMEWNDAPGRTQEQVLAAFAAATKLAQERNSVALKANLSPGLLNKPKKNK